MRLDQFLGRFKTIAKARYCRLTTAGRGQLIAGNHPLGRLATPSQRVLRPDE